MIFRIRAQFRQYLRIEDVGNLWRYHGFTDFDDILEFFILRLITTISRNLVIFDDDRHLNILLICSDIEHFLRSSVLHDMTIDSRIDHISPIDDDVTILSFLWLFCFWWYPQLIFLWRYPVIIQDFYVFHDITHF